MFDVVCEVNVIVEEVIVFDVIVIEGVKLPDAIIVVKPES